MARLQEWNQSSPWKSCWTGIRESDQPGVRESSHRRGIREPDELPDPIQLRLHGVQLGLKGVGGEAEPSHRVLKILVLPNQGFPFFTQIPQPTGSRAFQGR